MSEDKIENFHKVLDVMKEAISTISSPETLLLIILWNSLGKGRGFDGYITNGSQDGLD